MNSDWKDAISKRDIAKVCLLLDQGADINSRDAHGLTALMRASVKGQTQLVKTLAEHGADLDVTAKLNLSALMLAVINGYTDIAQTLVEAGADLGIQGSRAVPGFHRKTALTLARDAERTQIINLLIEADTPE